MLTSLHAEALACSHARALACSLLLSHKEHVVADVCLSCLPGNHFMLYPIYSRTMYIIKDHILSLCKVLKLAKLTD